MNPMAITPAERDYWIRLNIWRRGRFAHFPFRPGHRLPPDADGRSYLRNFFYTHEFMVPAFHRGNRVAVGRGECLQCDGTGWLLYVDGGWILAERPCEVCGGSGSWWNAQQQHRNGAVKAYRQYEPDVGRPYGAPQSGSAGFGNIIPGRPGTSSAPRRRRGAPGALRAIIAYPIFLCVAYVISQPLYAVTDNPDFAAIMALILGMIATPVSTRLIFGPLRDYQVLGPLWILVLPIYFFGGIMFVCSIFTRWDLLSTLAFKIFEGGLAAREALSRIPFGR